MLNMTHIDLFDLMEMSLFSFHLMMKVLEGLLGLEYVQALAQCPAMETEGFEICCHEKESEGCLLYRA